MIHILWSGAALCDLPGLPSEWPPDHKWIYLRDAESDPALDTGKCCPDCWERWRRVKEATAAT